MKMVSRKSLLEVCGKVVGSKVEAVQACNGCVELRSSDGSKIASVRRMWREFDMPVAEAILRQVSRGNNETYSFAKRLLRQA